jgi:hypothetical protein
MGLLADFSDGMAELFTALEDLAFVGTVTRTVPGTYDPDTGPTSTTLTSSCKIVFDTKPDTNDTRLVGLEILPTDEKMLLQGLTFKPNEGDTVTITARGDGTSVSDQPVRRIIFVDDVIQSGALYSVVGR